MRKIILALTILALAGSFAYAGEIFQRELTQGGPPLLQNNYLCNANSENIDLLCDLIAYYHFNESAWANAVAAEVKDSSGNGNHGTATVANTIAADCKLGRCGRFNN